MQNEFIEEKIKIGTKYPLEGLLTIPMTGIGAYPAVILVHGSGPNDMNEKIGNVYPFKDLAEGLAKRGIATIRYNKRTFTYGKEMVMNGILDLTVKEETIEDAIFAAELLKNEPSINPNQIFILGHSMGGMLAPRIDAEGGDFAGLIIWGGSPRRLEEIIIDQQEDFLKTANLIIKWIMSRQIGKIREIFERMYSMTDEEAKTTPLFNKYSKVYYLKEWGEKPAMNYLKDLVKPILIMHSSADFHVSIEKDFEEYKKILSNHPNASFKLYPGLNHLFMPSVYGDIKKATKEYKKVQNVEEYVIDDIAEWIKNVKG
jgi:dienelactone hydrolase